MGSRRVSEPAGESGAGDEDDDDEEALTADELSTVRAGLSSELRGSLDGDSVGLCESLGVEVQDVAALIAARRRASLGVKKTRWSSCALRPVDVARGGVRPWR